jgi:hypothetical protein
MGIRDGSVGPFFWWFSLVKTSKHEFFLKNKLAFKMVPSLFEEIKTVTRPTEITPRAAFADLLFL